MSITIFEEDPELVEAIWKPFALRKKVTGISGEAGAGKTTLLYNLCHQCQKSSGSLLEHPVSEARTFSLSFELAQSERSIKAERLGVTQAESDGMTFGMCENLFAEKAELIKILQEGAYGLLTIDPLINAFTSCYNNINTQANEEMKVLREIAEKANCAVVFTLNYGSSSKDQLDVYRGKGVKERMDRPDIVINFYAYPSDSDETCRFDMPKNRVLGGKLRIPVQKMGDDLFEVTDIKVVATLTKQKNFENKIAQLMRDKIIRTRQQMIVKLKIKHEEIPTFDRALASVHTFGILQKQSYGKYIWR